MPKYKKLYAGILKRQNIVLFVFAAVLIVLVAIFLWLRKISSHIFINNQPNAVYSNIIEQHVKKNSAFNILLLGYGGGTHEGTYLTDSIIIANVNPVNKTVTLISIPRDLWVRLPNGNYRKINAVFSLGFEYKSTLARTRVSDQNILYGANQSKSALQTATNLTIEKFVAIDFDGFIKSIDALGGVDINVEKTFDDYEYPLKGYENDLCGRNESELPELIKQATSSPVLVFPCRYEHLHFDAGLSHFDGETALKYVRSRHSLQDGTDFGRSKRQRNLIVSVKQQILNIGFIPKILPFISSLENNFKTDLSLDETKSLIGYADKFGKYRINSLALTNENFLEDAFSADGQYILTPKAGIDQWDAIQTWLKDKLYTSSSTSGVVQSKPTL